MNVMTPDIRFVTMEDIVGTPQSMNHVVYNTALPTNRRRMLFQAFMAKKYDHVFTEDELDELMKFDEFHLVEFVKAVKNIIRNKKSQ